MDAAKTDGGGRKNSNRLKMVLFKPKNTLQCSALVD